MEKNLWKSLNKIAKTRSLFMMRLETTTINGVPDVFCCIKGKSFFVELKANDDKKLNLSKYQILWQIDYLKAGGIHYVKKKRLFMFCSALVGKEGSW